MRTRSTSTFTSIMTEGALLPADLLRRISDGDRTIEGLSEASYHVAEGEKLGEAISRSWTRLTGAWVALRGAREKLPESDLGTTLTRDRWLLPLFQELGYGRIGVARGLGIDGTAFPISHLWQSVPIHLVSFRTDLDTRTSGVAGAAKRSPHSLVQEFLNKSDHHLWGFVSNGRTLRILRDNASLTRQAYVEFDLQAMFDGEIYADFTVLWLLAHQSRVEAEKPSEFQLESWSKLAREQGVRALDQLRGGVEKAIQALGSGFLAHPANIALKERLRSGALDKQDYYRQLLRLVYRLLFLFVAEDRDVLQMPDASPETKSRYRNYYSTSRLRQLAARRRGTRHADLWEGLRLVMGFLGRDEGCPSLGLPALGSFLFSASAIADLERCALANRDLLAALRELSVTEENHIRRQVDFKNLRSEELGSIYEALLELHPEIHAESATFELRTAAGHERKTTGSYYTPDSLVQCLLDSALEPVVAEAMKKPDPERAILDLKVCDPACGSGHFLVAAAHRIAKRLAGVRTGDDEPSPEATRHALRDVIGRCIYGVDLNPMAVELCKVALWMEAIEPGRPLSFLDHHVQCGNSLIGATPSLLAKGIPDEAFEALSDDDKKFCTALRKRNRQERDGQMSLPMIAEPRVAYLSVRSRLEAIGVLDDSTIEGVRAKEERWREVANSPDYRKAKLLADAWCAAFFVSKRPESPTAITQEPFDLARSAPDKLSAQTLQDIVRLADEFQFFHWHIAFPEVFQAPDGTDIALTSAPGWRGGFNLVLGNPPWDTLSPDVKEFFSVFDVRVRNADAATQKEIVERLLENPTIRVAWEDDCNRLYRSVHFYRNSGVYRLFAPGNLGKGDFNIYRMFAECALTIVRPRGYASQIVPENFYNGANAMAIRKELFERFELKAIYGFENTREVWFVGIDSRSKFCIYAARQGGETSSFAAAFSLRTPAALHEATAGGALQIPVALVSEFSPDAIALMEFRSQLEIDIARKMYARWPKFGEEIEGLPRREYMREVDMGNDRDLFTEDPSGVPVYEGRMVWQFDHRAKAYKSGRGRSAEWTDLDWGSTAKAIVPQWYIPRDRLPDKTLDRVASYRIGFCDVASPTNERSLVAAILPPNTIAGHSVPTLILDPHEPWRLVLWVAVANSFVVDFLTRFKVSLHMSFTILDSLPLPRTPDRTSAIERIVRLSSQLTCAGPEMSDFWNQLCSTGWLDGENPSAPRGLLGSGERLEARAELDALVARELYGITKEEMEFILDTFPTAKKYEEQAFGEFRTKRMILENFGSPS
ncbi:MAG: N-6 DNA methylase [Thermoanaerobaculia bacterium]